MEEELKHVLVVDDDEFFRGVVRGMLEKMEGKGKVKVIEAVDGLDALEKVKTYFINLAVVDLVMPRMGGEELCKELKKLYPGLPILVITGHGDENKRQEMMNIGVNQYMDKPSDAYTFLGEVGKLI